MAAALVPKGWLTLPDAVPSVVKRLRVPAILYPALRNVAMPGVIPIRRCGKHIILRVTDIPALADAYATRRPAKPYTSTLAAAMQASAAP